VTDASGLFWFGVWNPESCEVDEITPSGYNSTTPDTVPVNVVPGTAYYFVEFGEAPIPGDTNRDSQVNGDDLFFFSKYWHGPSLDADSRCNPEDDATVDEKDLWLLMRKWK
jgi:hypothetical protein